MLKSSFPAALCKLALLTAIAAEILAPLAEAQQKVVRLQPSGRGPIRADADGDDDGDAPHNTSGPPQFDTGNQIQYWGGPVLLGPNHAYIIWYGTFDSGTTGILTTLVGSIGGSPYFNITAGYFDAGGNSITNSLSLAGSVQNNYSKGKALHSSDVSQIVVDTISGGLLPLDPNGIYLVLSAGDVTVPGFGDSFCGYHSLRAFNNTQLHYAFIGNPAPSHLIACSTQPISPNGNPGADAMASTIAHELEETITDPDGNAWFDAGGNEIADKCAWTYGNTFKAPNGSLANMTLGGNNYLIQQDWVNASGGFCGLSASPGPDFALWATTDTQSVTAGSTTGSYTVSVIAVKGFAGLLNFTFTGLPAGAVADTVPPSSSSASFTISTNNVPAGSYSFQIVGSSGSISHPATLTLVVSGTPLSAGPINPEPSHVAQPYLVNFSVPSTGITPTGQVTVSDGSNSCSAPVAAGSCLLTSSTPGVKTITVTYSGDSHFSGSARTLAHTVIYGGSLSDLVSGSGWETTFTLVNLGVSSSQVSLNLFADTGNSLNLPFTFPQGNSAPLNAATLNQTIGGNSVLLLDTTAPANQALNVGWGDVSASGNVNAYEIFRYAPSAQEAVVPMETRTGSFALLFDNTSLVNTLGTGVALANLGAEPATVPIVVNDDSGAQLASGSIPLAAFGHTAFTLSNEYPTTAGKRGTVQITTPPTGQISVLGIRANGNSFTTIPAIQSGASGGSMAHIAAGGGWRSIFYVVNLNSVTSNVTLKFFDDSGNPLVLPLTFLQTGATTTAASVTQTLTAGAALAIESQGAGAAVMLGSAQLSSDHGASGFALFRYDPSGQEATAPLEIRNAPAYVLAYDNTTPLATGVALANLTNQTATVGLILRDDSGTVLQATTLQLPANGHSAFVLGTNYPLTAGKRGTVEFDSASAPISVLGIRANGNAFTSIPVLTR